MRVRAADMPKVKDLTIGTTAFVAAQACQRISRRTEEVLAVVKIRHVTWGNPIGAAALRRAGKGAAPYRADVARNADLFARIPYRMSPRSAPQAPPACASPPQGSMRAGSSPSGVGGGKRLTCGIDCDGSPRQLPIIAPARIARPG